MKTIKSLFCLSLLAVSITTHAQTQTKAQVQAQIDSLLPSGGILKKISASDIRSAFAKAMTFAENVKKDTLTYSINVTKFGAKPGDGLDDTPALIAAIAASNGEAITIPNGEYNFTNTITIVRSNVKIVGMGYVKMSFSPTTAKKGVVLQGFDNSIEGIHFVATNTNVTTLIEFTGNGSRGSLMNCLIEGHPSKPANSIGLHLNGATPAVYLFSAAHNKFLYFDKAMLLSGEAHGHFLDLNFHQPRWGIDVSNQGGLATFSNMFFQTNDSCAIVATGGMNTYIAIRSESNTAPTIRFKAGSNYNTYFALQNTGSGKEVEDFGVNNVGVGNDALRIMSVQLVPTYDIYVQPGSIFRNLGNANKLSIKKDNSSVVAIEP